MKLIDFEDVRKLNIDPRLCYQWVSEMIQNKGDVLLPPKISLKPAEGVFCNVMPCIISNDELGNTGGIKVVTRYPERKPSLDSKLLLMNADNGEFLALMDANWITAMRTGAVAAHSILLLAKSNFSTIAMVGLGNTARATLLVLASVLSDKDLNIKLLRYKGQEISFVERFKDFANLHFEFVETNEELVKNSDVVVSCVTYATRDFCSDDCYDEGVLVVPVHTLGFTNCDLFFDKVFADDYGHVHHFKNFDRFRFFAEVSDVMNDRAVGRENDKERILAYNIGLSMHDINYAKRIYQMMMDQGTELKDIEMKEPSEKFWI